METYTTAALAKISGISRDQLVQWDRAGLLKPARRPRGKVSERIYTGEQALGVVALGELRRCGVSDRRIRNASALLPPTLSDYSYLVFDGRMVYARSTEAEVIALFTKSKSECRVLEVRPLLVKLATASTV